MSPTKITLERTATHLLLRVTMTGSRTVVIESVPIKTGKSLDGLRAHGRKYAKRFGIAFHDCD